ncbi:hypothetical protein [Pseudooceanicola aestuarii]|uniref:hypothetical protein n=1 Tax=Pseudooceanicola aestuarii TaxID=2697319 RepID=UPI0013D13F7A|nr:hypothetical protein [Pseudooceanicola aestuarii]
MGRAFSIRTMRAASFVLICTALPGTAFLGAGGVLLAGAAAGAADLPDGPVPSKVAATALPQRGPALAAASNFGQGMQAGMMGAALALPVRDFRDAVYWALVARDGAVRFDTARSTWPDLLSPDGAAASLTVNNGHPDHDNGATPHSPAAIRAFGRHAAEIAARFPAVEAIEVGNEFNSANFVSGPLRDLDDAGRARGYAALLSSVVEQVRAVRPSVRIVGGGVHSVPTGYLAKLAATGVVERMDALALHPYDTAPEQLARQIAVLRRQPAWARMPIELTEIGTRDSAAAPGLLLRMYCQAALSGVTRLAWYPLNPRGDGYAPLIGADLQVAPVGRAFRRLGALAEGRAVRDIGRDAQTYGCLFGDRMAVLWGMPRGLRVAPHVVVRDALGAVQTGGALALSETAPLTLEAPGLSPADWRLAPQRVLADSRHGYAYPGGIPGNAGETDSGFSRLARRGGRDVALITRPGQSGSVTPWVPWLGLPDDPGPRLLPDLLVPGAGVEILHRFTAPQAMQVQLRARVQVAARSTDGVAVTVQAGDRRLAHWQGHGPWRLDRTVTLAAGQVLEIAIGANGSARGDVTEFRLTVLSLS